MINNTNEQPQNSLARNPKFKFEIKEIHSTTLEDKLRPGCNSYSEPSIYLQEVCEGDKLLSKEFLAEPMGEYEQDGFFDSYF